MYTVITSANPLDKYLKSEGKMKIHTVGYKHDHSIPQRVYAIYGDQAYRKKQWVQIGYNQTHTTVHDLVLIRLKKPIYASKNSRGPRYANLPFRNSIFNAPLQATGWAVAGFGYVDKEHVKNNSRLEVTTLSGNLVDCDEWMPREWGHFICVTDDDDLRRIPSGGPLILDKKPPIIYGIASFSLKKGNETILVFTNLKKYRNGLTGYTPNSTKL
ncbi:unnamed protein product [Colias eurytheme]|nr:unnamed protein product [Colias eurytheme]